MIDVKVMQLQGIKAATFFCFPYSIVSRKKFFSHSSPYLIPSEIEEHLEAQRKQNIIKKIKRQTLSLSPLSFMHTHTQTHTFSHFLPLSRVILHPTFSLSLSHTHTFSLSLSLSPSLFLVKLYLTTLEAIM